MKNIRRLLTTTLIGLALVTLLNLPPSLQVKAASFAAPNPLTCENYPEARIFLDAQAWWARTPGQMGNDFGHIHNAVCAPHAQKLTGLVDLDIRLILHNNPGVVNELNVWVRYQEGYLPLFRRFNLNWQCPPTQTCERWEHIQVDTRPIPTDGIRDFKIEVFVEEPDGVRLMAANYFRAYIKNGQPEDTQFTNYQVRAGAYWREFSYSNAYWISDLPQAPVSGLLHLTARFENKRVEREASVVRYDVLLDANFHAGIPGLIIAHGVGNFEGEIALDTTQLSNGLHRLVLRTHSEDEQSGSTLTGVLVVPFSVNNSGSPLPPPSSTPPLNPTATHNAITHSPTVTRSLSATPTATPTPTFVYTLVSPINSLTPCATEAHTSPVPITRAPNSSVESIESCAFSHTVEPPSPAPSSATPHTMPICFARPMKHITKGKTRFSRTGIV